MARIAEKITALKNHLNQSCLQLPLKPGKNDSLLFLILALAIGVTDLAGLAGAEKQNPAQPFVGVNPGWQGGGVGDFECRETLPLRLEWRGSHW